jgi:hypothetical protein
MEMRGQLHAPYEEMYVALRITVPWKSGMRLQVERNGMIAILLLPNNSLASLNAEQNNTRITECIYLKGPKIPPHRSKIKKKNIFTVFVF